MLRENKSSFLKLFVRNFIFLIVIFYSIVIIINGVFYFFPILFLKISDSHTPEVLYNKLRNTKWSWDIVALKNWIISWREAESWELLWDTNYIRSWSDIQSIEYYHKSLWVNENNRVRLKIQALSSWTEASPSSSGNTNVPNNTWSQTQTWSSPEIENSQIRSKESEENRGKYIQKSYDSYIIKDSQEFLELWIERKDW